MSTWTQERTVELVAEYHFHPVLQNITSAENKNMLRSPPSRPVVPPPMIYSGRLSSEQVAMLEAEFTKGKTLHSTDLSLLAAEMAVNERDVQAWYQQRMAAWRREQGLSDCFGQV